MTAAAEAPRIGFGQAPVRPDWSPQNRIRYDEALAKRARNMIRAGYDAAATNDQNVNHWANADVLSSRAAHSPAVRRLLRMRSRYEVANCPLAKGILVKLANFVVGTGPRLQVMTKNRDYNRFIQREYAEWCLRIKFARKLWQMRYSKAQNGEAFGRFVTNMALRTPVKLDFKTIEADQVADPRELQESPNNSDGIVFDDFGNAIAYRVLKTHPGDQFLWSASPFDYTTESAKDMVHYFTAERPGQTRGIPEITPSLPLFSMRRRYMLAVVAAAEEVAANHGVIQTNGVATAYDQAPEPYDTVDIDRNGFTVLPGGWQLNQRKAEQPTTTFDMFDRALIREIARCVDMPYGIAAGDSSPYNFASGKLDLTPFYQTCRIEQDRLEDDVADPAFERWYQEARLIPGYLPTPPEGRDPRVPPPRRYFWDGQELLDPRETGARAEALDGFFATYGRVFAKQGLDVEEEWEAEAELLGMTPEEFIAEVRKRKFAPVGPAAPRPPIEEEPAHVDD